MDTNIQIIGSGTEVRAQPIGDRSVEAARKELELAAEATQHGKVIDEGDIAVETLPGGIDYLIHVPTGRWVTPEAHAQTYRYAILNDDGTAIVRWFRLLNGNEIEQLHARSETEVKWQAEAAAVDKEWRRIIGKAKTVPVATPTMRTKLPAAKYTLDTVDEFAKTAMAKLTLARDTVVVVEAPDHVAVSIQCDEIGQRFSMRARTRLDSYERRRHIAAQTLCEIIEGLGDLAVEYVRSGKRPPVDVGRGKANKVSQTGAWI